MAPEEFIRVPVLGAPNVVAELPHAFFTQVLRESRLLGRYHHEPPPFAAACTDGLVVFFTVFSGPMSVSAHAAVLDVAKLSRLPTLEGIWKEAKTKPMSTKAALLRFGFPPHT